MTSLDPAGPAALLARPPAPALTELAAGHDGRVALVGGALRDALLGLPPRDLDLVVESGFERFLEALTDLLGRRPASIGDRFQDTHRFRWAGVQVDLARTQGSLEEDLGRRDFTVNAMALELGDEVRGEAILLDPYGGRDDLRHGRVRATGPGVLAADPLRLLRAVRYAVALPGFELEPATRQEIERLAPELGQVSAERKVAEWGEILQLTHWRAGLEMGRDLGVLQASLGSVEDLRAVAAWDTGEGSGAVEARPRFAALMVDLARNRSPEAVAAALLEARWPRPLVTFGRRVAAWHAKREVDADEDALRALEDPDAAAVAAELARRSGDEGDAPRRLGRYAARAREDRWVRGADLLALGARSGPALGELLETLAVGQLTGRWGDADQALAWARGRIAEDGSV